jgi:beta-galactosidase
MNRTAGLVGSIRTTKFKLRSYLTLTIAAFVFTESLLRGAAPTPGSLRERISIDEDWRFTKGDPTNNPVSLLYDVREQRQVRRLAAVEIDGNSSLNSMTNSTGATNAPESVIKQWILPSGDRFIKDPSRKFVRPEGNLGDGVAYVQPDFDDSGWQQINLPHDWAIAGPFTHSGGGGMGRLPTAGIGWYRKKFSLPAGDAGKKIFLDVDGAMAYSTVWLNGHIVGGWPYGYASWEVDLTPYAKPGGDNELVIRLDNPPNSSRWYPGAGIYRNVWLTKTTPVHVAHWGTYLTTPEVSAEQAKINLQVTVDNDSKQDANINVTTEIFALDADGKKSGSAVANVKPVNLQISPNSNAVAEGNATITNPRLWGPPPTQKPNRYVAVTTVLQDGKVVDSYETPFGIRTIKFVPNEGFFINGEHILLHGAADHHDLGALGAAFNTRAAQRQLETLQNMGCNAIRTSHNPPAPELLELADRMGLLLMDEMSDCWQRSKTPNDFHLIFDDWHEQDMRAQIRRDRNSPAVTFWSIGNEVGEQYTDTNGAALAKQLCDIVHDEDPTRPTITAMNYAGPDMPLPAVPDVIGLNYRGEGIRDTPEFAGTERIHTHPQYDAYHAKFPDKVILSTETASAFSSRGVYLFPVTKDISSPVRDGRGGDSKIHQVSAYELYAVDFGSSADKVFASIERHPFVAGEFVWCGWDYLGEPTPYDSSRSSYAGIIDLAGFKKDRFYLYQSHWRPDFPMAHILPHWTWPERIGQVTPVHVFTSGDEAELFLNGQSLGRKKKGQYEYRLRWDGLVYQPGTLKVVAYKNGKIWATDEMKTAGEPTKLKLEPDRSTISADGKDLSFVTVTVTDKDDLMAPRADNHIHFDIKGPGEIVATDNGDPTSFEAFQSHDRKIFNGLCLVIVRGKAGEPGRIELTASADGLKPGMVSIETKLKGN